MFSPTIRLFLVVAGLIGGILRIASDEPAGWMLIAGAALLAYGYFRYGTVWLAFQAYRRGDIATVERRLRQINDPARLRPQDRAYYEFLSGVAAQHRADLDSAHAHLSAVSAEHLRTDNIRSVLECHRAEVAFERGNLDGARRHLDAASQLRHGPAIDDAIKALQTKLMSR